MDHAVQSHAGHDVDKDCGNFVQAVEDHQASPHGYTDGIVSKGQAVGTDEKSRRPREQPDRTHTKYIHNVAKIGQEEVEFALVESIVANRQKVEELPGVPIMEILRPSANDISAEEYVEDTTNEEYFLPKSDRLCTVPILCNSVNIVEYIPL